MIEVTYPDRINQEANIIGTRRDEYANSRNVKAYDGAKTKLSSLQGDIWGATGELVVEYYCQNQGIKHDSKNSYSIIPVKGEDIIINGFGIDVKAQPLSHRYFMVFKKLIDQESNVKGYIFVRLFGGNKALLYNYSKKIVSTWKLGKPVNKNREVSYYKPIPT